MYYFLANLFFALLRNDIFWQATGAIGGLIALYFIYKQVRYQRNIAAFDFLDKKYNAYYDYEHSMDAHARAHLAKLLLRYPDETDLIDNSEALTHVLCYFENLGLLCRKEISSPYLMWTVFCDEIIYWWSLLNNNMQRLRKKYNQPALYVEFEYLYNLMRKEESKQEKQYGGSFKAPSGENLRGFLLEELNLRIIKAEETELRLLSEIDRVSFNKADSCTIKNFNKLFAEHSEGFFLIKSFDDIAGYFIYYLLNEEELYIESIAIEPSFRRLGIAEYYLEKQIKFRARDLGCKKISLHVDQKNDKAIALYKKTGFNIIRTAENFYDSGHDAFYMEFQVVKVVAIGDAMRM